MLFGRLGGSRSIYSKSIPSVCVSVLRSKVKEKLKVDKELLGKEV